MNALKNLLHGAILALWALMGIVFTFQSSVFAAGSWWLWFIGFAAVTTFMVGRFKAALAAPIVHGAIYLLLLMVPRIFPLSVFRLGIDLLGKGA